MAQVAQRREQNSPGSLFVDKSCIDCGTCYWMAPKHFSHQAGQSAVSVQPHSQLEKEQAAAALLSCPTNSIGFQGEQKLVAEMVGHFPRLIADDVYHCGFHAESSFGASSYFIQRVQGNIMIDAPRYMPRLAHKLTELGGLKYQLLTHKDDVADTDHYQAEFKSTRAIHQDDANRSSRAYEWLWQGSEAIKLDDEMLIIPVPGHTKGHCVFLYRERFLFTGDHLAYDPDKSRLYAFRSACWFDWATQIASMEKLLAYPFEYLLPGHGDPIHLPADEMQVQLRKCIDWMKTK